MKRASLPPKLGRRRAWWAALLWISIAAILAAGCIIPPPKPPAQPTPTPVVGGLSCGALAGPSAQCTAYAAACPPGLVDRGATYDCRRCCGTPPPPTPTPVVTTTPWASHPSGGTGGYFCCCGWEGSGYVPLPELAGNCDPWSTHFRVDPWDFQKGAARDLDRVAALTADPTTGRLGIESYLDQITKRYGKRLVVGALWSPALTAGQSLLAGPSAAVAPEIVWTARGYHGKILKAPGRAFGFSSFADVQVCGDPQWPAIAAKYAPYKKDIDAVEVVDEPSREDGYTRDGMTCVLGKVDEGLRAVGMPLVPRMVMFTRWQIEHEDTWRALDPARDWVGFEVYVDPALTQESEIRAAVRETFFAQYRLTAPYHVQLASQGYTRNFSVTDTRVVRIILDETAKCVAEVLPEGRITLTLAFSYMRDSGIRYELDRMGSRHILDGVECMRHILDGQPGLCAPLPTLATPTPAPTPIPPTWPGSINVPKATSGLETARTLTLDVCRHGQGSAAPLATVDYATADHTGSGDYTPMSGTLTFNGGGCYPITLVFAPQAGATGHREVALVLRNAKGAALEDMGVKGYAVGRYVIWDVDTSVEWLTKITYANPDDCIGVTLLRGGATTSALSVVWRLLDGAAVLHEEATTIKAQASIQLACAPVGNRPGKTLTVRIVSAPGYTSVHPDQPIVVGQ